MKAFSWRVVSESSEKFQPTTSRKSRDSVLSSCTGSSQAYSLAFVCMWFSLLGGATWISRKQETKCEEYGLWVSSTNSTTRM